MTKDRTPEFLEEAYRVLNELRKQGHVPGWVYSTIVNLSRGRSANRRRNRAVERIARELMKKSAATVAEQNLIESNVDDVEFWEPEEADSFGEMLVSKSTAIHKGSINRTVISAMVEEKIEEGYQLSADGYEIGTYKSEKEYLPGDVVSVSVEDMEILGFSKAFCDDSVEDLCIAALKSENNPDNLGFYGPKDAKILFVGSHPSDMEIARKEMLVGETGRFFKENYLAPLGLQKSEVAFGFAVPVNDLSGFDFYDRDWASWTKKQLDQFPCAIVVALGKYARQALGKSANLYLPHPAPLINKSQKSQELTRKLKKISKALDAEPVLNKNADGADETSANPADARGEIFVEIQKRDDERRVALAVVLDPNRVDGHNDWIPPKDIEDTAYRYMREYRVVGDQHVKQANGVVVESFIEAYPSQEDRQAAMEGRPHRITSRKYGSESLTSGSWVLGIEFGPEEWEDIKAGRRTGLSIGARAVRIQASSQAMPETTIIELVPSPGEQNEKTN